MRARRETSNVVRLTMHGSATQRPNRLDVLSGQVPLVAAYPVRCVRVPPWSVAQAHDLTVARRLGEHGCRGHARVRVVRTRFECVGHVAPRAVQRPVDDDMIGNNVVLLRKVVECALEYETARLSETHLVDFRVRNLSHSMARSREHLGAHAFPLLLRHFFGIAETRNGGRQVHGGRPQIAPRAPHATLVHSYGDAHVGESRSSCSWGLYSTLIATGLPEDARSQTVSTEFSRRIGSKHSMSHNVGTNAKGIRMPIMSEMERLRRKELRRRPRMMEWARALGLLVEEEDEWTVVVPRKYRRSWGDDEA